MKPALLPGKLFMSMEDITSKANIVSVVELLTSFHWYLMKDRTDVVVQNSRSLKGKLHI
jgi:hypothetical protein